MTGETDSTGHYINGIAVDTMKVTELRSTLAQHGLSTKGVKKELLLRLVEYIKTTQEDKAEDQKVESIEVVESVNVEVSVADSFQELQNQPPADEQENTNENDKLNESFIEDSSKDDLSVMETLEGNSNGLAEPTKDTHVSQNVSLQEEENNDTTKCTSEVVVPIEADESKDDSAMETSASEITDKKVEDKTDKSAIHENGFEEETEADNESNANENKKPESEEKSSGVSIESRITRINIKKDDSDSSQEKPRAKKRERIVFESDFKGLYSNSSTETLESPMPSKKRLIDNDVAKQEEKTVRHGLLIENLQRPWNNGTIKRKLETFGKILSDSICSNEKKTVCLVLFENEETAVTAQKALDGTTSLPCSSQGLVVKKIDGSEYNSLKENINSENGVLSKPVVATPPKKMIPVTTTDQQIKKDYDRDGRKSLSKTENHHQKDSNKDHQTYKSSKGPEKDKDTIMSHRFAGLFPLETKNVIYINNLTRPFCALQLKAMLQVHNTMLEDHFHLMDKKSKCIAVYKNEEAATAISAVLAENKFPQDELGKILNSRIITFEEYIRKLSNSRIEGGPHVDPSSSGDHVISESKAKRNSPSPRKRSPIPERKSHLRREDHYKREPNVAPSLPGMKVTDAKPSLAFADNSYKMPSIHDGWETFNRNERFEDRRRRNDIGFNRRRRSISRDRR
uniref:SAP domain-containing protein n=1 Tax=Strongyloides venezuelensis TaxID=75913 RepID=A0A0K0EYT9_STRVS